VKKIFLYGNWKMHNGIKETETFFKDLCEHVCEDVVICDFLSRNFLEICIFPPFTSLFMGARILGYMGKTGLFIGAQNGHYEEKGAFTGEISFPMVQELGCTRVLLGHSERRHIFNESNELINKKLKASLQRRLRPVLCIGETFSERESDLTFQVLENQINAAIKGLDKENIRNIIWAYEPVWAIGTGRTASPENAQEACCFARSVISKVVRDEGKDKTWNSIPILYGGSVKASNVAGLLEQPDIDGALIGGASLSVESMLEIVHAALHRG
jgi:triosephosphate isomerase